MFIFGECGCYSLGPCSKLVCSFSGICILKGLRLLHILYGAYYLVVGGALDKDLMGAYQQSFFEYSPYSAALTPIGHLYSSHG